MNIIANFRVLVLNNESGKVEITNLYRLREDYLSNFENALGHLIPKRNYNATEVFEWGEAFNDVHNKRYLLAEIGSVYEALEKLYEFDAKELRQMGIYTGLSFDELKLSLPSGKTIEM